jgi:lysophospholipase L1-like esterase
MRDFPLHTALSIVTLGALIALIHPPNAAQLRGLVEFTPELTPLSPMVRHVDAVPLPPPARAPAGLAHGNPPVAGPPIAGPPIAEPLTAGSLTAGPLLDDSSGVLDAFYRALSRTGNREPGAVTRIVHYGDSPTTADLITGDVRALLQARFGDAGHGFILPAKPWAWYQHAGVRVNGSGWEMVPASRFEARDGLFGLGGVSFTGGVSADSKIVFEKAGYTQFEIWFLRQPEGGILTVIADDVPLGRIDTSGPTKAADFAVFQTPSPASTLALRVVQGHVRLFGVSAENGRAGLVYDSLGLNGASITVLSRMFNQSHWATELQHRHPDLVVVNYGTNEADFPAFIDTQYEKELREAIRRLRAALPETSLLIMSPMDRGYRTGTGEIETMPTIPRIVALQRRVARETGCGFFDTFQAMGGEGTMARWYTAQPRLVSADFIHPYPAGGKTIAVTFVREIVSGLNRYQLKESQNPSH